MFCIFAKTIILKSERLTGLKNKRDADQASDDPLTISSAFNIFVSKW